MQRRPPWTTTATRTLTCRCWLPLGGARAPPPTRSLVSRNSRGSTQYTLGPGHGRSGSSSVPGLGRRLLLGHSAPPRGLPSSIAVLGQREFSSSPSSCSTFSLRLSYGCMIWVTILGIWGFWLAASLLDFDFSLGFPLTSAPPCRTPTSSSTTARSARGSPRHCIAPATAAPRGRSGGARPYHRCRGGGRRRRQRPQCRARRARPHPAWSRLPTARSRLPRMR